MTEKKKNFIGNFIITSSTNILFLFLALANNIIITRYLEPDERGIYGVVSNLVIFLNLVLGEGIRRSNTILIGKEKKMLPSLFSLNVIFLFVLALVYAVIFCFRSVLGYFVPNLTSELFLITFLISLFIIMWQAVQAIYLGLEKINEYNLLLLLSVTLILVFNVIGIYIFDFNLNSILSNLIWANFIVYLFGLWGIGKMVGFKLRFTKLTVDKFFSYSARSTFTSIIVYLMQRSGIFFVNYFANKNDSGFFAVSMVFSDLILRFPNVAGTLVFSKTANKSEYKIAEDIARVIRAIFLFSIIVFIVLTFFGKFFIVFLFGEKYESAYIALKLMLPGLLVVGSGSVIHSYFMGKGYQRPMIILNFISGIVAVLSYYILVKYFMLSGAGIAYSVIIIFWTAGYIILFVKETGFSLSKIFLFKRADFETIIDYFLRFKRKK